MCLWTVLSLVVLVIMVALAVIHVMNEKKRDADFKKSIATGDRSGADRE